MWIVVDMNRSKELSVGQSCCDEEAVSAAESVELRKRDWSPELTRQDLHAKKAMEVRWSGGERRLWRGLLRETRDLLAGVLIPTPCQV